MSRLCCSNSSREIQTMRYFMTVWLIVHRVSASPLLTNSPPNSLLDYDDTFSSNWMVSSQPIYSLSQNDLGDGCSFKDGSVSCGSVDPIPALPSPSPPLEDTASQPNTPSQLNTPPMIQEATIAATSDKKCDYRDHRNGVIYTGICNENLNQQCVDVVNPDGTTEKRYNVEAGTHCDWAVGGREAVEQEASNKNYASRGCCIRQMNCLSPYPNSLCMADDDDGKQECRKGGGWLEVFNIGHCPSGMRCCLAVREEYDPTLQKTPIFHHDDGTYEGATE